MNALAQIKQAKIASDRPIVDMLMVTVDAPPSTNNLFVNVPGKGRRKSREYAEWCQGAATQIMMQRPGRITGYFGIALTVRRLALRKRDLDNFVKPVLDLIKNMGVIEDDSYTEHLEATWSDDESLIGVECRLWSEPRA